MAKVKRNTIRKSAKELVCPKCGGPMHYDKKMEFWKCLLCEGEFWPKVEVRQEGMPIVFVEKMIRECYVEDIRVGFFGFGGKNRGGSKSGRRRKDPPKPSNWAGKYLFT